MFRITDRSGKSSSNTRRVWVSALQRTSGLRLSTGKKRSIMFALSHFELEQYISNVILEGLFLECPNIQCIPRYQAYNVVIHIQVSDERPESGLFLDFSSLPTPDLKHLHIPFYWNFLNLLELSMKIIASNCSITMETSIALLYLVGDSEKVSLN